MHATISCKSLVKIGPVVSAEYILIEIVLGVHVVVQQSFHRMKALYVPMIDLYLIFQYVKGRCHGNQILLP